MSTCLPAIYCIIISHSKKHVEPRNVKTDRRNAVGVARSIGAMGKAEAGTPKGIANKMKAKGLQKLRWFCQVRAWSARGGGATV